MSVRDSRQADRLRLLQHLAVELGRADFDGRHPDLRLPPVVVLVCAYEEEEDLGAVLAEIPTSACGLAAAPLVVVDGGSDGTARVAREAGACTFELPVNLGHGVALRVGYDVCVRSGSTYVVTLDADGRSDPTELEQLLQPVVDDEADFVVASRRLGVDRTDDRARKAGVVAFAGLVNMLNGTHLTDTSNGYRALRTVMLADVLGRLEQDHYQAAELLTTAVRRGWRVTERPTAWHPRASGTSKKGATLADGLRNASVLVRTWLRER